MNKWIKRMIPATLAMAMVTTRMAAYADTFVPTPGKPYEPAIMEKLEDNVMEYDEIEKLIDTYNTSLKNLREKYADSKDSMSDIDRVKDTIYNSSDQLANAASDMAGLAESMKSMIGFESPMMGVSVLPSAYAEIVYNVAVMEYQADQILLSADQLTEMSPEMMRLQMIEGPRASLIGGAQSLMIAHENILLQKKSLLDSIALAEAGVQTTERMAALGMGTAASVDSAKKGLSAAKAGLITLEANEVNIRQQLCTMLGWAYDASPEIPVIPAVDTERIAAMNLNEDIQTALTNNVTLRYNRLSEETFTKGSVQMENLMRTIQAEEAEVAVSMTKLYNAVLQKESDLLSAKQTLEMENVNADTAERQYALGMLSKMELMQKQNTRLSAEINVRVAELSLLQAVETYEWAKKGSLSLSQ